MSDNADYPENIQPHVVYFVISLADAADVADRPKIQLARPKQMLIIEILLSSMEEQNLES